MTWDLRVEEPDAVLQLSAPERYAYFVKRCVDWEQVWGLRDERGWVIAEDSERRGFMPIWPHPAYASACATDEWASGEPTTIELDEWIDGSLPGLRAEGHQVSVFPVPAGHGVAVEPDRLERDLRREMSLYQ